MNRNELLLDRVREIHAFDLETGKLILRLTSIEEPSIKVTNDKDEQTDAIGNLIAVTYKGKKAVISGTNSLFSTDLLAKQYGSEKEIATSSKKIDNRTFEVLTVGSDHTIDLKYEPKANTLKYIYTLKGKDQNETLTVDTNVDTKDKFKITSKKITVHNDIPEGTKILVDYVFEDENAMQIRNRASKFPSAVSLVMYNYFKDVCNENLKVLGTVYARKAKLNPENLENSLASTGKHPFEFEIMKDYCTDEEDDELFTYTFSE